MSKLIMTKGLPGCGKTTWAKEYQKENPNTVRVNKDDLRAMLHDSVHSKGREGFVLEVRNFIINKALKEGHDVIADDTNFNPVHEVAFKAFAEGNQREFEVKDFTDVSLEECIRRDSLRDKRVGEKVIKDMYKQYLRPIAPVVEYNPDLYRAIVCDLDGTLALFGDANPYDRDFLEDIPNFPVVEILIGMNAIADGNIILVSGRDGSFREQTKQWLERYGIPYRKLHMRKAGDKRKDFVVKQEIYENHIKNKYNVLFVLDDRDQVVNFWRSVGLPCFQVAEGDF